MLHSVFETMSRGYSMKNPTPPTFSSLLPLLPPVRIFFLFFCLVSIWRVAGAEGESTGFGLSFRPDYSFGGSDLKGWQATGTAQWRAENGELIGTSESSNGG